MAKRFKWVAFSHDWSYEVGSETTFVTKDACYNDMRTAVLNKMRWNTEYNDDFTDGTDAISYKVWFERGMIVHQSYSGTYVYLIVNEDETPSYYDVFNDELRKRNLRVETGIFGFEMYRNGQQFYAGDGLVVKGVENSIENFGRLARIGMRGTDEEIIRLMTEEP